MIERRPAQQVRPQGAAAAEWTEKPARMRQRAHRFLCPAYLRNAFRRIAHPPQRGFMRKTVVAHPVARRMGSFSDVTGGGVGQFLAEDKER